MADICWYWCRTDVSLHPLDNQTHSCMHRLLLTVMKAQQWISIQPFYLCLLHNADKAYNKAAIKGCCWVDIVLIFNVSQVKISPFLCLHHGCIFPKSYMLPWHTARKQHRRVTISRWPGCAAQQWRANTLWGLPAVDYGVGRKAEWNEEQSQPDKERPDNYVQVK